MAIPSTTTITQVDELPGKEYEFGIGDVRWIMRNNADLYGNRELAVAREYSTNAADAHVEAGVTRPIEVTLPSALNPNFTVRDYGEGMDLQTLTEVYTMFGDSTKRKNAKVNGMLGYGCKSAVAYTNTFTVTSIYQGIKNVAVITRRPDWSIVMKIVATSETNEPSGTEVKVPVHNPDEFAQKAKDFYKFWLPGLVLVNGKEPQHYVGKKIVDGLYASPVYGNSYVVMGNVPYKIENAPALFQGTKMQYFHFVAYVENGEVEFPPSREGLKYTEQTKRALRDIVKNLEVSVKKAAADEIAKAKTPAEAFTVWHTWRNSVGIGVFDDLTYKGERLQETFEVRGYTRDLSTYGRGARSVSRYSVMEMPTTLVVTEFFIEPSADAKRKAKDYANLKGYSVNKVLFTPQTESAIVSKWIPRDQFVTWKDLRAALPKKVKAPTGPSNRPAGSWDFYEGLGYIREGQTIPAKGNLYYVTVSESRGINPMSIANTLGIKDAIIIRVPQNRLAKFQRDYPKIQNIKAIARNKVVKDGKTLLCDKGKALMNMDSEVRRALGALDIGRLDDPQFKEAKALIANEDALLKPYRDNLALAKSLGLRYYVQEYQPTREGNWYAQRYPLARIGYQGVHEDTYVYINAKYAVLAEKEKKNG